MPAVRDNATCTSRAVALDCVANGKLLRERIFDRLWLQQAAGGAGRAIGAALDPGRRALA